MKVKEICTTIVTTVEPQASVIRAAELMRDTHVGCLVVTEVNEFGDDRPIGVVTDRDITLCLADNGEWFERMKVRDLMASPPVTIGRDESAASALSVMQKNGVRRLPVVSDEGILCGILSMEDLLSNLIGILSGGARLGQAERREEIKREIERVFRSAL